MPIQTFLECGFGGRTYAVLILYIGDSEPMALDALGVLYCAVMAVIILLRIVTFQLSLSCDRQTEEGFENELRISVRLYIE